MSQIIPNTQKLFLSPNPQLVKDTFVYMGRRYFLLSDHALISEQNKNHFLPPADRGFYVKLPKKDFKDMKKRHEENKTKWLKAIGYLKAGGVQNSFAF